MEDSISTNNMVTFHAENESKSCSVLTKISKKVIELYNDNPDYPKKLVRNMYNKIEDNPNISLDVWMDEIDEIKQGGN